MSLLKQHEEMEGPSPSLAEVMDLHRKFNIMQRDMTAIERKVRLVQ